VTLDIHCFFFVVCYIFKRNRKLFTHNLLMINIAHHLIQYAQNNTCLHAQHQKETYSTINTIFRARAINRDNKLFLRIFRNKVSIQQMPPFSSYSCHLEDNSLGYWINCSIFKRYKKVTYR
jgi:hypothetical protein